MTVVERLTTIGERLSDAPLKHLPPDESVYVNQRQHPAVLVLKSTRTGAGVGMMVSGPTVGLLLIFAGSLLADTLRRPVRLRRRTIVILVVLLTLALFAVSETTPAARTLGAMALLFWIFIDLTDWFYDRLVVTDKRLYRIHGVFTVHRPSVALQSITVIDLEMGPAARWFGTLQFDTPAQRDSVLERFTFVRDAGAVHILILNLRSNPGSSVVPLF